MHERVPLLELVTTAICRSQERSKYVAAIGLANAEADEIEKAKEMLTIAKVPWVHRTKNLPKNGLLVIGNFARRGIDATEDRYVTARNKYLRK